MRVLVVDDNAENVYMLEALLKGNGHETVTARDGVEALAALRGSGADFVISDILMPRMDGYQLCREVRAEPAFRNLPFVFYTATYADPKDFEFGLGLGADRFLVKPMDPEEILKVFREVVAKRAAPDAGSSGPPSGEAEFLRLHNEALFRKLEKKVASLEETNRELEREIRTRERVESELRESERRFRDALEFLPVPIGISERGGKVFYCNREFTTRFGYALSDLPALENWPTREIWDGESPGAGQPSAKSRECQVACKNGEERIVQSAVFPIGELCLAVHIDVTEQRRTEELLRHSQKMEALGTMASGVAHDFNNLLTIILSCATLLKMHSVKEPKCGTLVDEIMASVERASEMTRSLLAFSRNQPMKLEPGDVNNVILTLEKSLRRLIREDIEFRVTGADAAVPVMMDRGQIEQVIINLAVNARDAMPSGGVLSISSSVIRVTGTEAGLPEGIFPGMYALLKVSDTGIGMDSETLGRIFEPFFTTKEPGKGTGLGLSIVYGNVARHGGFLKVNSEKGRGTKFSIYLPVLVTGVEALAARPEPAAGKGSGTVLLVEDEESVRFVIGKILEDSGYAVVAAPDGETGLAEFRKHRDEIVLVVSDLVMPSKNGKTMCDEIRAIRQGIPCILISGYPDDIVLDEGEGNGRTMYLRKPIRPSRLMAAVEEVVKSAPGRGDS